LLLYGFQCQLAGQDPQQTSAQVDPCLKSTCRDVPARDTLDTFDLPKRKFDVKYRALVGGFSQGAGFAGGIQATTAESIPHVQVRANLLTSTQLDQRFDVGARFDDTANKNHVDVWFSYVKRQTDFYGVGPHNPNKVRASFDTDRRSYQATYSRNITNHFQSGFYGQVRGTRSGQGLNTNLPPITDSFSGIPDIPAEQWIPGFLTTTQILSYGGFLQYDLRDRSKGLTRGLDIYLRGASNDGIHGTDVFGDFGWIEGEADIRAYIPLGSPRTSLALRSENQFKSPKGGSQIPFYDLSFLGGRDFVRGYAAYRFRGNNVLIYAAELRRTVRRVNVNRGWDVFGFVDTGKVWGDSRSETNPIVLLNQQFNLSPWRTGVGAGIEYRRSSGFAVRAELSHSKEGNPIYLLFSRGF
jgi:hypothetical protein